jgi:hypothetical protein
VHFATGVVEAGCPRDICQRGRLTLETVRPRRLRIAILPAAGQKARVTIRRGKHMCAISGRRRCPARARWFLTTSTRHRVVRLGRERTTIRLPRGRGDLDIAVSVRPFRAQGRRWDGVRLHVFG